ncbi:glycoside hydrolase family 24 protein [Chryseobacterium luteum]|uniref:Uncharacterized protein n=1 Tax=Chryseobacterium luteum TaxID=421531 RepID=A0A085YXN7_9FLAO|nr:glycoside hydrolase family 104 protein [Chryseobacterium luteum]KFE96950.1 hypothetical protein IX38_22365 [Chryseobacterium luteum]
MKTTGNSKQGDTAPYTFNQSSLTRKGVKICVTKGENTGELIVKPKRAGQPKINKIELLDINGNKVTKPLSYSDTLTVKAYCTDMEGETVQFTLWEDDAKGEGHNTINSINKINAFPVPGTVKKGVAKANFNMATYTMASFMANIQVAKGDKNEGKTHEYYATAEYFGKLEASNNVNLKNPSHHPNPAPTSGNKSGATKPPAKQQPNQRPVPPLSAPKKDTYKTPVTPKAKTQSPDPQGKIISAEFVDMVGKPYKSMKFGTHVKAKIISKNMAGKTVRLKIWEDDISNVLLFEKDYILGGDETFITLFLTAQMRKDGDDWKEGNEQEYFLEIEYAGQSVDSEVINVNDSAPKIKVAEPAVSMTGVGTNKEGKNNEKGVCECEAKVRAFIRMVRVGEGTGELIKALKYDKETKKNETVYITHNFQSGYTTAFGGNKITDLSTHPQKNYGGSTAAGAYQVMRYTWWWLNGEELDDDKKKTGIYNKDHDYIKKYKISDFSAESQDKICIALMKAQRPNLIGVIIKNEIENAIQKDGCFIWASLPENNDKSHYKYKGKLQPATPLKVCIEHYNKFLKEELSDISPLHLKKGFLKDFDYDCCTGRTKNDKPSLIGDCQHCKQDHYDVTDKVKWQTQFDSKWGNSKAQGIACKKTCDDILNKVGLASTSKVEVDKYQTAMENKNHTSLIINTSVSKEAIQYIDDQLNDEKPVQVGVDHALNYKGGALNEGTTDHFVVIIGKGCDNGKIYYRFYDVGTKYENKGASKNNKLFLENDYSLKGTTVYSGQTYTVTQVRKNKKK